jgi:uncharacterized membrane protein YjgN (DUF898 family)
MVNSITSSQPSPVIKIDFNIKPESKRYYWQWFKLAVLQYLTLDIYSFWATSGMRKLLAERTQLLGEKFSYTGTAKELAIGSLIYLFIFIICIVAAANGTFDLERITDLLTQYEIISTIAIPIIILIIFLGSLPYFSLQYRLSHNTWKGLSFILKGSAVKYSLLKWMGLLSIFTLNFATPYFDVKRNINIFNNLSFGNNKISLIGISSSSLMKTNIISTILLIPTLGFSRAWYYAELLNLIYGNIDLNGVRFKASFTGRKIASLWAINVLVLLISIPFKFFGNIGYHIFAMSTIIPWILNRNSEFFFSNIEIVGDVNTLDINPTEVINSCTAKIDYSGFCLTACGFNPNSIILVGLY